MSGPSAYTGGLWVAALAAFVRLCEIVLKDILSRDSEDQDGRVKIEDLLTKYRKMFERAKVSYETKLWNGSYYNYDSSSSYQSNSIMADQLAGQWYARACGLPPIITPERARSALRTVFTFNVMQFGNGKLGAVNGMRPNTGRVDNSSMQSREVWVGTTYAVASAMLQESYFENEDVLICAESGEAVKTDTKIPLRDAAFVTARGIWESGWGDFGCKYSTQLQGFFKSHLLSTPFCCQLDRLVCNSGSMGAKWKLSVTWLYAPVMCMGDAVGNALRR